MQPPTSVILATVAANGFLFGALLIPPSILGHRYLAAVFLPLIWCSNLHCWQAGFGFFSVVQAFWATDLLIFRNPREDFKLIHISLPIKPAMVKSVDTPEKPLWKESYPETLWARIWWVNKLVASFRLIGWDTGDQQATLETSVCEREPSRGKWLVWRCVSAALCFLAIDATSTYQHFDPYFLGQLNIDAPLPNFFGTSLEKSVAFWFVPRMTRITFFGLQQYTIFSLVGSVYAIFCVSLGGLGLVDDFWGRPSNWPPLMGNPLLIFQKGLCGLWGKVWHQIFRHMFVDPGKAICRSFDIPTRSMAGYAVQITVAFILSGALHALTLPRDIPDASPLRYAGFFWLQGICVLVEVMTKYFIGNSKKILPAWMYQYFGFVRIVWVVGVLYYTLPLVDGELLKVALRAGTQTRGPISFTKQVVFFVRSKAIEYY